MWLRHLFLDVRDGRAFRCPQCGAPAQEDDFQCERCELILNPDSVTGESGAYFAITADPSSVVRAMLSPPARTLSREIPAAPVTRRRSEPEVTTPFEAPRSEVTPRVVASIDLALSPLDPFEAYLASFIDGKLSALELARVAGLGEIEVVTVLHSLKSRGVVELLVPAVKPVSDKAAGPIPTPDRPEGQLQKAIILERHGQFEQAIEVLRSAIASAPKAAALYHKLGMALLTHRRDFKQAEELMRKALRLEPGNPVYRHNLDKVRSLSTTQIAPIAKRSGLLARFLGK